ncbi:MAG: branched-chain amino acid transporter periplasmic protein [Subtercola sp.]|nr:branched-chain amino acid transporter periplasmic protein [Subtercola sp.]
MSQRNPFRTRAIGAGIGLTVAALALAGCSGSSSTPAASNSALSGDPIGIGVVASESGAFSDGGTAAADAAKAWESQTNADGGLGGRPVKVTIIDSKTTAPGGQSAVSQLVGDPGNLALVYSDLASELQVDQFLQDQNIAVLSGGGSGQTTWTTHSNLFNTSALSDTVVDSNFYAAQAAGATDMGWGYCVEAASCQGHIPEVTKLVTDAGLKDAGSQPISGSAASYTAECLSWIGAGANAIGLITASATDAKIAADCIQQGYNGLFAVSGALDTNQLSQTPGMKTVGAVSGFPWWADAAPVQRYRGAMKNYASNPDTTTGNGQATSTWGVLELLKKAIGTNTASLTRQGVIDAMDQVKNETLDGLLPQPITFTAGQPSPVVTCFWNFTYTGGDSNPKSLAPTGKSGNGASGDLASSCATGS